jgi:hypothetical protein
MSAVPAPQVRQLAAAIAPHDTAERRAQYLAGDFDRADRVKDLDKRYRWDLYWLVRPTLATDLTDVLGWSNDACLDTALRRCVPPLAPSPTGRRVIAEMTVPARRYRIR